MKVIAVYPGRFHPFHKGHAASFKQLASRFGLENTYLAISAKQDQPKSPFSAQDRAKMAMALGIPSKNIIAVKNPYSGDEYMKMFQTKGYDPEHTALVFGVSKKDMEGDPSMGIEPDPRFSFKPKKDGTASYFQPLKGKNIKPMTQHGYILSTDVAEFPIAGKTMRDASAIRKAYAGSDNKTKMKILTDLYGDSAEKMKQTFDNNLQVTESIRALINKIKPLISEASPQQKAKFVKLLSEAKKTLRNTNPCWDGYKPVGTKKKNGKTVPNCVPVKESYSVQRIYGPSDVNIVKDLGNGYLLSYEMDEDDDVRKEGFEVVKLAPNETKKYIPVGTLKVSPYPGNRKPGQLEAEINRIIAADEAKSPLDEEEDPFDIDPELNATVSFAQQHYRNPKKQAAFIKFVQRSLKHSKEDDERLDKEVDELKDRVDTLDRKVGKMNSSKSVDFPAQRLKEGTMKPTHVTGEEKSGSVEALEKALLRTKAPGVKLDYDKIDKMMQLICKKYHLTGDKLHNDFVKKHRVVPDKWIVKQTVKESFTKNADYLDEK